MRTGQICHGATTNSLSQLKALRTQRSPTKVVLVGSFFYQHVYLFRVSWFWYAGGLQLRQP